MSRDENSITTPPDAGAMYRFVRDQLCNGPGALQDAIIEAGFEDRAPTPEQFDEIVRAAMARETQTG